MLLIKHRYLVESNRSVTSGPAGITAAQIRDKISFVAPITTINVKYPNPIVHKRAINTGHISAADTAL